MTSAKTATLTFRIAPSVKEVLCEMAEQEHRSIANMVEVMIRDYCQQHGLEIDEKHKPASKKQSSANHGK